MSDYINNVMLLVQQLEDIDKKVDDEEVAEILLSGLPQEYDVLVSSLETACLTNTLSSDVVRMRLLQEEHRRNSETASSAYTATSNRKKREVTCTFCKKQGHVAKRCFKRKREQNSSLETQGHTMLATAFSAITTASDLIGSEDSRHNDGNLAADGEECDCIASVANGQHICSEYMGRK
ncbi:uncharacterized protein LOC134806301 [Cydia splendana]|uniref:uncharacterized protein LOC134806301 n=1 Tax=Cydia splendana TaxID=1100963 RepID=UPI0021360B47